MNNFLRKSLFVIMACLPLTVFAATGLVVDQAGVAPNGSLTGSLGKTYLLGDKFRMEDRKNVTIGRLDRGVLWLIDGEDQSYVEMPMQQGNGKDFPGGELFRRTGHTRKIGQWDCYEVTLNPAKRTGWLEAIDSLTLWISTQPYAEAATYFASIFQAMGIEKSRIEAIQTTIGKGFPIEVHMSMLGSDSRQRVVKIESKEIPNGQFEPNPGFKKQVIDNPMNAK